MNGSVQKKRVIITDLDGSLLHPRTYSFDEAKPALELAKVHGIPLVLVSSKTRAELEVYRDRLANRHPFVSENGGGIFIPEGYFPFPIEGGSRSGYIVVSLGAAYADIRRHFTSLRDRLQIAVRGFGDMTVEEVMEVTGLARDEASLALMREYEEPFVFEGTPDDRFLLAITSEGYTWTQGKFFHIMGNHDKGKAVNILRRYYERACGGVTLIGLGDSLNDLPLLQAVDRPVLIRKSDGTHDPRITIPGLYRTAGIGPAGWNEAVLRELS
jgi:mannosyl-3-phosphoglycerate phosphatase